MLPSMIYQHVAINDMAATCKGGAVILCQVLSPVLVQCLGVVVKVMVWGWSAAGIELWLTSQRIVADIDYVTNALSSHHVSLFTSGTGIG